MALFKMGAWLGVGGFVVVAAPRDGGAVEEERIR